MSKKKIREWFTGYAYLLPMIVILGMFVYFPAFNGLRLSFYNKNFIKPTTQFVGFENFKTIPQISDIALIAKNTAIWAVCLVALPLLIGLIYALTLNFEFKGKSFILALVFMPWVLPPIVVGAMWDWILNAQNGILNYFLQIIGLIGSPINFLGKEGLSLFSVIGVMTWRTVPFVTIMLLGGLGAIPKRLYEAAEIDGANIWHQFIYITLPQLKGVLLITGTIITTWAFRQFAILYTMTNGGPYRTSEQIPLLLYKLAFKFFKISKSATVGTLLFFFLAAIGIFYVRLILRQEGYHEV